MAQCANCYEDEAVILDFRMISLLLESYDNVANVCNDYDVVL